MASISVPCPKCSVIVSSGSLHRNSQQQQQHSTVSISKRPLFLAGSTRIQQLQGPNRMQFPILKAQVHEVDLESSSNSSPVPSIKLETLLSDGKDAKVLEESVSDSTMSAFMAEVSDLVRLVDSRDITELQLKKTDCELIIRKKEALPQPPPSAPFIMMQPPPQAMHPTQPSLPHAITPTPAGLAPSAPKQLPPSLAKGSKSSLPPLKCPMAGTFYRCAAPGEPPFVKVGDKVNKGQVVCIIEAMKLMNEIEADQSGTIIEILAEDGKPVSVDLPLLVIEP